MCNCIQQSEKLIEETFAKKWKKPILAVSAPKGFVINGDMIYLLPFEVELKGQRKLESIPVEMKYCPLCGKAFKEKEVQHG